MPSPKVSIIMPVFNARRHLRIAVESMLAQTFTDFELIAVDDGSRDNSLAQLESFARRDPRVRAISRPNTGIVGALNDALAASRGSLIARMDADDWCTPERLACQVEYCDAHPDCVALGTWAMYTDPAGRLLKPYRPAVEHDEIVRELCRGNGGALVHASCMFRREAVEAAGNYRREFDRLEDLDLFARLTERGVLANLPAVHYFYRQHPASINHNRFEADNRFVQITRPLRERCGLPPLTEPPTSHMAAASSHDRSELHRRYALDAIEGGHLSSAWANLLHALARGPLRRTNLATTRYLVWKTFGSTAS